MENQGVLKTKNKKKHMNRLEFLLPSADCKKVFEKIPEHVAGIFNTYFENNMLKQ